MRATARLNGHVLRLVSNRREIPGAVATRLHNLCISLSHTKGEPERADTELDIILEGLVEGDIIHIVERDGHEYVLLFDSYGESTKFDEYEVLASNLDLAGVRFSPIWENMKRWEPVVLRDLPLYVGLPYKGSGFAELLRGV